MSPELPESDTEFSPSTQEELRAYLVENFGGPKRPIVPVGGGTSLEYGPPLADRAVKVVTRGLDRVVEFAARDMTITVEAGISIARLDEILRGEGLRLPIDIPQWERATLGGALAANASGPRRFGLGTFRDYVIGLTAVKADGQVFHSGGRVVKNVAGYDLCKLLVGSQGTLAIVTQVTLKLKPIPEASALVCAAFANLADRESAMAGLLTSQTRPIAIDSLNAAAVEGIENQLRIGIPSGGPALVVGYEGTQRETDWQTVTQLKELAAFRPLGLHVLRNADAGPLWSALTEFAVPGDELLFFESRLLPSKISQFEEAAAVLPIEIVARAGNGAVFGKVAGPTTDQATVDNKVAELATFVAQSRGTFRILRGSAAGGRVPVPEWEAGAEKLMRRLKSTFDPANVLNPLADVAPR
ncbi:MAG TPA: FAD-binding oxidoreductase [Planctomycetaceae bacterium]|jgi:glycolate oxidase FAD binding subunit|nr:FAD-binding oxidoreductase [Planctomycetaceae bacterium]